MIRSLYSGATGMYAQQMNIDNIANNLANINTNGFKQARVQFQDLIYQTMKEAGSQTSENTQRPVELSVGSGVKPVATQKSFIQGSIKNTGNPLDIAVSGEGFFKLTDNDGNIFYSRDGSFKINQEGQIVNAQGLFLEPGLQVPSDAESINVSPDGIVSVKVYGVSNLEELGQIELARFVNPAGLKSKGGNLYEETVASGEAMDGIPGKDQLGYLEQGHIEASNVIIVEEMVNMIVAQRAYDLNSKVIKTSDQMIQSANQLKR